LPGQSSYFGLFCLDIFRVAWTGPNSPESACDWFRAQELILMLNAKQEKLLILAMDPGCSPGEFTNAAIAFFRSLKGRYKSGHELLAILNSLVSRNRPVASAANGADYGLVTLPFGKYRGRQLRTVPVDYLLWMVRDCDCLTDPMRDAIKRFLSDEDFR
jgi:hypothetical protein